MSADKEEVPKTKFAFERTPYWEILYRIKDEGSKRVKPTDLAAEIRKHGVAAMPEPVQNLLCEILEDKFDRRGRKGLSKREKVFEARHVAVLHTAVYSILCGRPVGDPSSVAFVEELEAEYGDDMAKGEKAWRIVSRMVEGSDGHYRKLQNLVSKFAPKNPMK